MKCDRRLVVLSFDPGGTTGWAALSILVKHIDLFRRYGLSALEHEVITLTCGQIKGSERRQVERVIEIVEAGISNGQFDHLIFLYEDFILRKRTKSRDLLSPVRITARIQTVNQLYWDFPETFQQPSLAKTAMPDKVLRKYHLHTPGMPHANDAKRHALTLVRRMSVKQDLLAELLR